MISYPDFVEERINRISDITKIDVDKIQGYYEEFFSDDFIQKNKEFDTNEERHKYAVMVLWAHFISRPPPIKETETVPVILRAHASVKEFLDARARVNEELSALLYDLLDLLQAMYDGHQGALP